MTGEGPAAREHAEQTKEREVGGRGEQNVPVTVSGVQQTVKNKATNQHCKKEYLTVSRTPFSNLLSFR